MIILQEAGSDRMLRKKIENNNNSTKRAGTSQNFIKTGKAHPNSTKK